MSSMLKFLCALLALLMLAGTFAACNPAGETADTTVNDSSEPTDTPSAPHETSSDTSGEATEAPTESPTEGEDPTPQPQTTRPAQEVKVISMNLDANETTAGSRVRLMAPLLLSFDPDSIGVQEARGGWINLLKRNFLSKGYARVGVDAGGGQDAANGYFATYILYKEDKFDLVDWGTFWLTNTPETPSKYGPTVDTNRTCTWALLEDKETGFRYVHMNAHLDWMDMEVNKIQVEMIQSQIERFEAMGYPVFAGGDYNCDEGTASYLKMLESDVVADAKKVAEKANDIATYPSYGEYDVYDPSQRPIDYFFVTKDKMTVKEYRVVDEKPEGKYISDHFPVFVHALVHETPMVTEGDLLPRFAEDTALTAKVSGGVIELSFPQATDKAGIMASGYRIELTKDGKTVLTASKSSGVLTLSPAESLTHNLGGLTESGKYTVFVTPINIFGDEGPAILADVEFTYAVVSDEMPAADILDLRPEGDTVKDFSPNSHDVTKKGTVKLTETDRGLAMEFTGNGNYAIHSIKDHYAQMESGFTMELLFTTPADLSGFHSIASNMHAGGFGFDWEDGVLTFSARFGGNYLGVDHPIQPDTTYHAVGVYTGHSVKLFINGALAGETPVSGSPVHPTDNGAKYLCIGADSDATGAGEYPCKGLVYLVRMYTVAATDGQAFYLYEQSAK